ncbi:transcription factor MYB1R1-like [Salvia hispanica]|uniref:transcription factor MYB1R1-like n=1 Tax=Salvia hispanica TaxID=49212 RepID=UPI002009941D|nr:transcription factor MYB1R1-like [Salvia hispanica]
MSQSSLSPSSAAEIMLFGVRVRVDPMRKSVSMNNLSEYEPVVSEAPKDVADAASGYASADDAVPQRAGRNRDRKRGIPWTEDEHKLFLLGLAKVGRGDWRGISRNYVKSRTPTQVASHAQKYFLRRSNSNRRRRRSSLFDITTDSVSQMPIQEAKNHHHGLASQFPAKGGNGFPVMPFPVTVAAPVVYPGSAAIAQTARARISSPAMLAPWSSAMLDLSLRQRASFEPQPLSLRLSLSSGQDQRSASAFQMRQSIKMEIAA